MRLEANKQLSDLSSPNLSRHKFQLKMFRCRCHHRAALELSTKFSEIPHYSEKASNCLVF